MKKSELLFLSVSIMAVVGMLGLSSFIGGHYRADSQVMQVSERCEDANAEEESDGAVKDKKKVAYVTFDDGPSVLTEKYLDILEREQVVATFFVIGEQIQGDMSDTVRRQVEEGHEIGLHSYSHKAEEIYQSEESYCKDLQKTWDVVEKHTGCTPSLYRFPWGSANDYISSFRNGLIVRMRERGLEYADWNVSGEDAVGTPRAEEILRNIEKSIGQYDEPVILLHDGASCGETLEMLPLLIKKLKAQGYSFDVLSKRGEPCHFACGEGN